MVVSAELWYHLGSPLTLTLGGSGAEPHVETTLARGSAVERGERPQQLVPPGVWQTARNDGSATLVSCIVSPAFHPDEFRLEAS